MVPESTPDLESEVEVISGEEADRILQEAMAPYLEDEWRVLREGPSFARLTRGLRNLDIRVDLLGKVEITESDLTPTQDSGRLVAWVLLITMLLLALVAASVVGII
jgi:hypothetical protein